MISVISVVNNEQTLKRWLLSTLPDQSAKYEFIKMDNTSNRFSSASQAYNYGSKLARGDYLMFVHQDVRLLSRTWLEEAERMLRSLPNLGAAGVAGKRPHVKGVLTNAIHSVPPIPAGSTRIQRPTTVQTLDSMLMITPRDVFRRVRFDETVCGGWHLYVEDYCLMVKRIGLECYVLPLEVYHKSDGMKPKDKRRLLDYGPSPDDYYVFLKQVLKKHFKLGKIYVVCGDYYYTWLPLFIQHNLRRVLRRIRLLSLMDR